MFTALRHSIQKLLHSQGLDIRAYNCSTSPHLRLMRQIQHKGIDLVWDVGANDGGFGRLLYSQGYKGRMFSFEPQSKAHKKLCRSATIHGNWTVAPRCAVGDQEGTLTMNLSQNTLSSSALPMLKAHAEAAPESIYIGTEEAPVYTLDKLFEQLKRPKGKMLLKIDTQGYESQVLAGAKEILPAVEGIYLEMSLTPLYEGQVLYGELYQTILEAGFEFWGASPGFSNEETGRVLQVDGSFFRKN